MKLITAGLCTAFAIDFWSVSSMGLLTVASDLIDEVRFLSIGIPTGIENMCNRYGEKECNGSKQLQKVRKCLYDQKKRSSNLSNVRKPLLDPNVRNSRL